MTFVRLYIIYIYKQRGQLNRLGSSFRSQLLLENASALGSRIPPHAVLLQVNDNTLVKLKIIASGASFLVCQLPALSIYIYIYYILVNATALGLAYPAAHSYNTL